MTTRKIIIRNAIGPRPRPSRDCPACDQDGVGTPKEVAYGLGYHAQQGETSPYSDAALSSEWARGKADARTAKKLMGHEFKSGRGGPTGAGMKRNVSFQQPRQRDQSDFKSERGFVAKVLNANGSAIATSQPFISDRSAQRWLNEQKENFAKMGKRVTGQIAHVFFDPDRVPA